MLKVLAEPDTRKKIVTQGVEVRTTSGPAFDAFYKSELARWTKVVQEAGIKTPIIVPSSAVGNQMKAFEEFFAIWQ